MTTTLRTSSWTVATSDSSPSNIPQYSSSARGRRQRGGEEAHWQKNRQKLGAMRQFQRFFFFKKLLELTVVSQTKNDVRLGVSAIVTAKTAKKATEKRQKCRKLHSLETTSRYYYSTV